MELFGSVAAILNEKHLLLKIDPTRAKLIVPGTELQVFSAVETEQLKGLGLPKLYTVKGSVRVILPQTNEFYLAERFIQGERVEQRPTALGSGMQSLFTQEVKVGGTWSAKVDDSQSLNLQFETQVRVGDPVGRQ